MLRRFVSLWVLCGLIALTACGDAPAIPQSTTSPTTPGNSFGTQVAQGVQATQIAMAVQATVAASQPSQATATPPNVAPLASVTALPQPTTIPAPAPATATNEPTATAVPPTATHVPPTATTIPPTKTPAPTMIVLPVFKTIFAQITKTTKVPVRLPSVLPGVDAGAALYASIAEHDATHYYIYIDLAPDCNGATACAYATVYGKSSKAPFMGDDTALAKSITGYFNESQCGASCGPSTLGWYQGGNLYIVSIKGGTKEQLVQMANSAITNG